MSLEKRENFFKNLIGTNYVHCNIPYYHNFSSSSFFVEFAWRENQRRRKIFNVRQCCQLSFSVSFLMRVSIDLQEKERDQKWILLMKFLMLHFLTFSFLFLQSQLTTPWDEMYNLVVEKLIPGRSSAQKK